MISGKYSGGLFFTWDTDGILSILNCKTCFNTHFVAFISAHFLLFLYFTSRRRILERKSCLFSRFSCMFVCIFNTCFPTINLRGQTRCDCRKRRRLQQVSNTSHQSPGETLSCDVSQSQSCTKKCCRSTQWLGQQIFSRQHSATSTNEVCSESSHS